MGSTRSERADNVQRLTLDVQRSMFRRAGLIVGLIAACAAPDGIAQAPPVLNARARVRVWGEGLPEQGLVARLLDIDGDSVRLFADSARPRVLLIPTLRRFEVSRGRNRLLTLGLPVLGAGAGAIVYPLLTHEELLCREEIAAERECDSVTSDVIVGAAAGFIVTSVLTNIFVRERWVGFPLEELTLRPGPERQLLLRARLRF